MSRGVCNQIELCGWGRRGVSQKFTAYRARGVSTCDFDRDGDLDVYVSNYRLQPNILWQNDGNGKFTDITGDFGALANGPGFGGGHSIGASWGDFDNDGNFDLFAGNFAHKDGRGNQPESVWLRNTGKEGRFKFENLGLGGGFYQESYSSPSAADYDNDGNLDLFFTTVYGVASFGRKNNPVLFRNEGEFKFSNANVTTKLEGLSATYQAAWELRCIFMSTIAKHVEDPSATHFIDVRPWNTPTTPDGHGDPIWYDRTRENLGSNIAYWVTEFESANLQKLGSMLLKLKNSGL